MTKPRPPLHPALRQRLLHDPEVLEQIAEAMLADMFTPDAARHSRPAPPALLPRRADLRRA